MRDVDCVGKHARGLLLLKPDHEHANAAVMEKEVRTSSRLGVLAVVGFDKGGAPAVLLEVGIGHANPWGSKNGTFSQRKRTVPFAPSQEVCEAILKMLGEIAWQRMRTWQYGGLYSAWVERERRGRKRSKRIPYYNGIRFVFSPRDKELIEYLRWQEVFWGREVDDYVRYRVRGIRRLLAGVRRQGWRRGGKLTTPAAKIISIFKQSRTLRDPYVLSKLLALLYPGIKWPPPRKTPLVHFLLEEGVLTERFYKSAPKRPMHGAVRNLNVEVRFSGRRPNGMLVWKISPQAEYFKEKDRQARQEKGGH